tara:strand:+ start:520 stop:726 length:207 start_codon:yes stop_codon:yes gene_type:complete
MKRTYKRELILDKPSFDLNKSSSGCAPCLREVSKIDRQVNGRSLNEIKINEIKTIVRSIFDEENDTKN